MNLGSPGPGSLKDSVLEHINGKDKEHEAKEEDYAYYSYEE